MDKATSASGFSSVKTYSSTSSCFSIKNSKDQRQCWLWNHPRGAQEPSEAENRIRRWISHGGKALAKLIRQMGEVWCSWWSNYVENLCWQTWILDHSTSLQKFFTRIGWAMGLESATWVRSKRGVSAMIHSSIPKYCWHAAGIRFAYAHGIIIGMNGLSRIEGVDSHWYLTSFDRLNSKKQRKHTMYEAEMTQNIESPAWRRLPLAWMGDTSHECFDVCSDRLKNSRSELGVSCSSAMQKAAVGRRFGPTRNYNSRSWPTLWGKGIAFFCREMCISNPSSDRPWRYADITPQFSSATAFIYAYDSRPTLQHMLWPTSPMQPWEHEIFYRSSGEE